MKRFQTDSVFFNRYYKQAVIFEVIGGVCMAASIAINYLHGGNSPLLAHITLTLPGIILLIWGGSSLMPHNMIKAFSSLCMREPGIESAKGLLAALQHERKVSLVNRTIQIVYAAIEAYASCPEADEDLLKQLRAEADTRITKKIL